jgi:hypothetical protein
MNEWIVEAVLIFDVENVKTFMIRIHENVLHFNRYYLKIELMDCFKTALERNKVCF